MDAWKNAFFFFFFFFSAGKTHVHKIPRFRGGGYFGFFGGGVPILIFMGARIFLKGALDYDAKPPQSLSKSYKPHPSKPHPCNMPPATTDVALQFLECCAEEVALQHSLFCSADVILTKSCAAANETLHCNIAKAALQESGAFLPLSCGCQAPTCRHPRLRPAESPDLLLARNYCLNNSPDCHVYHFTAHFAEINAPELSGLPPAAANR